MNASLKCCPGPPLVFFPLRLSLPTGLPLRPSQWRTASPPTVGTARNKAGYPSQNETEWRWQTSHHEEEAVQPVLNRLTSSSSWWHVCHIIIITVRDGIKLAVGKALRNCCQVWGKNRPSENREVEMFSSNDLQSQRGRCAPSPPSHAGCSHRFLWVTRNQLILELKKW